jgi:Flp pilus assembly protein TadD
MTRLFLSTAVAALLALAGPTPSALAAGGNDTSTAAPAKPKNPDLEKGTAAIQKQNWSEAITHLIKAAATETKNADIQNWLGFAYRKSGDHQKAFEHYTAALQIDAKHKGAHEYIGEAYLETNNLAKAEEHLKKLDEICTFGCQEFRDLRAAIQAYKKRNNIAS